MGENKSFPLPSNPILVKFAPYVFLLLLKRQILPQYGLAMPKTKDRSGIKNLPI
jgi:hypothetical protein